MSLPPVRSGGKSPLEERALIAEREAQKRIQQAEDEVLRAKREADSKIESIRDHYQTQQVQLSEHMNEKLENEKLKGYENIRRLKQEQARLASLERQAGEKDLQNLKNYFADSTQKTEQKGELELQALQSKYQREVQDLERGRSAETELNQKTLESQLEEVRQLNQEKIQKADQEALIEYQRIQNNKALANQEAEERFIQNYTEKLEDYQTRIAKENSRGSRALENLKQENRSKLQAYSKRNSDPFYRAVQIDGKLRDEGDYFEFTARVPIHEQKGIQVSIQGNQLIISGSRRNSERLEESPGRVNTTHSFQSFSESFPLDWPVKAKNLTKQFEGQTLMVRIPKEKFSERETRTGEKESKAFLAEMRGKQKVDRPRFPDNLPLAEKDRARTDSEDPLVDIATPPSQNPRSGNTLG